MVCIPEAESESGFALILFSLRGSQSGDIQFLVQLAAADSRSLRCASTGPWSEDKRKRFYKSF